MNKIELFGISIDAADMNSAVDTVLDWCRDAHATNCRYVVTPNVDHVVMYQSHLELQKAYQNASLVLADGAPVVLASRLLQKTLPERVAGSDLVPALFDSVSAKASNKPLRVFLLGAGPGVAERAAQAIHNRWNGIEVVGTHSPPMGFEDDVVENKVILNRISQCTPDLLLVGLGAPKQELWVSRYADRLEAKAALCIGATIDFLAGEKDRSPQWMQRVGLEWLHRLGSEPSRLASRYLRDAWVFPQLVWREWRHNRKQAPA